MYFCCQMNDAIPFSHDKDCSMNPNAGKEFLTYPDGIGDVRFHLRDGSEFTLYRVQFETIGGEPRGHRSDTSGDFESGELFHVPNVLWWEVVYN